MSPQISPPQELNDDQNYSEGYTTEMTGSLPLNHNMRERERERGGGEGRGGRERKRKESEGEKERERRKKRKGGERETDRQTDRQRERNREADLSWVTSRNCREWVISPHLLVCCHSMELKIIAINVYNTSG